MTTGSRQPTDVLLLASAGRRTSCWGLVVGVLLLHGATALLERFPGSEESASPTARKQTPGTQWWRDSPWAWSVPAAAAAVCVVPALMAPRERWFGDLLVYAGSGGTVGIGQDVYAYRTMFGLPFTYPPFAAVLAEPLSRIPWPLLQALWCLATLAAVVGIARLVLKPVVERIGLPLTVAAVLVTSPLRSHIRFGQVGVFLVLLVAVDLLGRRRPGVGLGLAVAIKLTPAVFLPWLGMVGDRRRLRTATLWAGGSTLAGLLLLWPSASDYLLSALWDSSRFGANDIPGNQSVRGILLRSALPDRLVGPAWLAVAVLLAVIGLRGAARLERDGNRLAAVAVLACLSVAVSPISWVHHLVWLAFPIAALVAAGRTRLALDLVGAAGGQPADPRLAPDQRAAGAQRRGRGGPAAGCGRAARAGRPPERPRRRELTGVLPTDSRDSTSGSSPSVDDGQSLRRPGDRDVEVVRPALRSRRGSSDGSTTTTASNSRPFASRTGRTVTRAVELVAASR